MSYSTADIASELNVPYSARSWQRFLDLLQTLPYLTALQIHTNDAKGRPARPFMSISCTSVDDDPRWLLTLECDDQTLADTGQGQAGVPPTAVPQLTEVLGCG